MRRRFLLGIGFAFGNMAISLFVLSLLSSCKSTSTNSAVASDVDNPDPQPQCFINVMPKAPVSEICVLKSQDKIKSFQFVLANGRSISQRVSGTTDEKIFEEVGTFEIRINYKLQDVDPKSPFTLVTSLNDPTLDKPNAVRMSVLAPDGDKMEEVGLVEYLPNAEFSERCGNNVLMDSPIARVCEITLVPLSVYGFRFIYDDGRSMHVLPGKMEAKFTTRTNIKTVYQIMSSRTDLPVTTMHRNSEELGTLQGFDGNGKLIFELKSFFQ